MLSFGSCHQTTCCSVSDDTNRGETKMALKPLLAAALYIDYLVFKYL